MDWSENELCIKCNEGGSLLICSENGCPLAVHERCMGCPARFNDAGRFYCPYCLYKQAVEETRRARECALARKKALLLFMDEKTIGSEQQTEENKRAEDNGGNESKISKRNVKNITCYDGKSKSNSDAILDKPIELDEEQKIGNAEEEKISNTEDEKNREEDSEASAGSKGHDPSLDLHKEQKISNEEKKNQEEEHKNQEEDHENSAASSDEDGSHKMHEHKLTDNEHKKIQDEESDTISDSTGEEDLLTLDAKAQRGSKRRKPVKRDSDTVTVPSKQLNKNKQTSPIVDSQRRSSRRSSAAPKIEKVSNEVVGVSKISKKSKQSLVKLASDAFGIGKRKRLLWREAEEEALRAGVEKYSKEANKNIPWRKILDLGKRTFDATRTPSDLKDKWRKVSAK